MYFDKSVIEAFLKKLNSISDIIEFSVEGFVSRKDEGVLAFEAKLKGDILVLGGIINFTKDYYMLIELASKKFFNSEVHFNNTGGIFWIFKK